MTHRVFSLFLSTLPFLLIANKVIAQIDFSFLVYNPDVVYAAGSSVIESTSKPGEIYTARIEVPKGQNGPPNSTYWSSSSEYTTQLTQENSSSLSTVPNSDVVNTSEIANLDTPIDSNESTSVPVFAVGATASVSFQENDTSSVYTASAIGANSYSISGGDDASLFTINTATGEVSFNSIPDYENPVDNGSNNSYSVTITATNTVGSSELSLSINVTDDTSDDSDADAMLVNISTRGYVGTGSDVLIGGFVISGDQNKTVLIRTLGPSLASQGVSGSLADPFVYVVNQANPSVIVGSNDNWASATGIDEIAGTIFEPGDEKDSAMILTLQPGAYTAIVQGINSTTGVALIEVNDFD